MRPSYFLPILFAVSVASVGSATAQTVVIEDDWAAPPVVAAPGPIVVPSAPVVAPGVVVIRRAPIVAAPFAVAPPPPVLAAEPIFVAPPGCPYGYGYC
jgi:hypothetical protein